MVGAFTFWVLVIAVAIFGALALVMILVSVARTLVSSRVRLETIPDADAPDWFSDAAGRQGN
jgi:hypothetical protein